MIELDLGVSVAIDGVEHVTGVLRDLKTVRAMFDTQGITAMLPYLAELQEVLESGLSGLES